MAEIEPTRASEPPPQMTIRTRLTDAELQKLIDDGWRIHHAQFVTVGDAIEFCAVFARAGQPASADQPAGSDDADQDVKADDAGQAIKADADDQDVKADDDGQNDQEVKADAADQDVRADGADQVGTDEARQTGEADGAAVKTVKPSAVLGAEADTIIRMRETARKYWSASMSDETYEDLLTAADDVSVSPEEFTRRVLRADIAFEDRKALLNRHLFNRADAHARSLEAARPRRHRTIQEIVAERKEKMQDGTLTSGTDQRSVE